MPPQELVRFSAVQQMTPSNTQQKISLKVCAPTPLSTMPTMPPCELASKFDCYMTYKAYSAYLQSKLG